MKYVKGQEYALVDQADNTIGIIHSVKQVENWYLAKIKDLNLTVDLKQLFDEVESFLKSNDVSSMLATERKIIEHGLKIKETDDVLFEIQMAKKDKIYFKVEA